MDSVFGMFFWALAIIAFGACIGAGLRGRPGRLFGLTILKIGLAGLFVMLLFVDSFPHNEIILWLLLMLMAGALICLAARAGWQRVLWGRMMSRRGRIDGNAEPAFPLCFSGPFPHALCGEGAQDPFFFLSGRRGGRASAIDRISRFSPMTLGKFSFRYASESPKPSFGSRKRCGQGFDGAKL